MSQSPAVTQEYIRSNTRVAVFSGCGRGWLKCVESAERGFEVFLIEQFAATTLDRAVGRVHLVEFVPGLASNSGHHAFARLGGRGAKPANGHFG